MDSPHAIRTPSFAKINWILRVLGRRRDSFHEISTILQSVDLADELSIEANSSDRIRLQTSGYEVAQGEDNLVWRAAALLKKRAPAESGAHISLRKRIPVGAGLGGGSSNAAVTLLVLNQLWGCGLKLKRLRELAGALGSDVPFFLLGGAALGKGRGELLTPLPDPPKEELVLCYPGFSLSTAKAYRMGGWPRLRSASEHLTKSGADTKIRRFCEYAQDGRRVHVLIENDFDAPLLKQFPQLTETHRALKRAGCERVALCGSGSMLLGVSAPSGPEMIVKKLSRAGRAGVAEVFQVSTLSGNQYRTAFREAGVTL